MKAKRFLSTVVAGALVAAQMAMPVMAADGGEVDVEVTTKTAVIRVEVPTTLSIAVNQFEKGDTGSQIYSSAFDITNKSEIPVKLSITSTATLDTAKPITLTATKAEAGEDVSTDGAAWLAVAAQTSAGKYIEESGKDIADLTEASKNVTTFVQGTAAAKNSATASQTFYLDAVANPTVTYTKVAPADADELAAAKKISYAKFYELTEITLTSGSEQDDLDAAIAAADIYVVNDSDVLSLIAKGTENITYDADSTYYNVAVAETLSKDLATGKIYVYGEAGVGGAAGFRYVGKLSEGKETWSASDISKIKIKYDITGVTGSRYAEVEDSCTYGLYAPATASTTATEITAGGAAVEITIPDGVEVTKVEKTKADGTYNELPATHYTWADTENGKKLTVKTSFTSSFGTGKKIKVSFSSGDPIVLDVK